MSLTTSLTRLLTIDHPILLAPMDLVADANLTASVSAAGGLGILGGGYGEPQWLARQLDLLANSRQRFGVGFITWESGEAAAASRVGARTPADCDHAVVR
jgi:nitronate monooxygenase